LLHVLQLLLHLLLHGNFFLILNRVQGALLFRELWMKRRFVASGGLLFPFLCCDGAAGLDAANGLHCALQEPSFCAINVHDLALLNRSCVLQPLLHIYPEILCD
jgi:hypothetical protein